MQDWADFKGKVKSSYSFSHDETRLFIVYVLILGFIVGFNDGRDAFDAVLWVRNLVNCIVIVALTFLTYVSAQKLAGLKYGQKVELKLWLPGLLIGVVLALFTNGEWTFLVSGGIVAHMMTGARLGKFRYGFSYNDLGKIAAAGPLACVALAIILKGLMVLPGGGLLTKAITVCLLFAIFNMLPIPPLAGSMVFFASRSWYVFSYVGILAITALLLKASLFWALLGSILIGIVVFMIFFVMIESKYSL